MADDPREDDPTVVSNEVLGWWIVPFVFRNRRPPPLRS